LGTFREIVWMHRNAEQPRSELAAEGPKALAATNVER
jgi:hypothetical protein